MESTRAFIIYSMKESRFLRLLFTVCFFFTSIKTYFIIMGEQILINNHYIKAIRLQTRGS